MSDFKLLAARRRVDRYAAQLLALQDRIERGDRLTFAIRRYLIEARKPEAAERAW